MIPRPRSLPKFREQVVRHLTDPDSVLRRGAGDDNRAGLERCASHLRAAELYWVAPDMAALAVAAGGQLAAASWATADRPSGCGLLAWGGGVGHIAAQGVTVPIDAVSWGPHPDGCALGLFVSRARIQQAIEGRGEIVVEQTPPLLPVQGFVLPVGEPVSMADLPEGAPGPVLAALAAAWLLMQQPQLVDRVRERADKPVRRAAARAGRPDPDVTVVDLRRRYVPDTADGGEDDGGQGRRYRHRWVVSGHWRSQPHGPDRALRRQTWIPAYVKGPDGAPLLATERVNVWRR